MASQTEKWLKTSGVEFRHKWWVFLFIILVDLVKDLTKDRWIGFLNRMIDEHSGAFMEWLRIICMNEAGVPTLLLGTTVAVILIHAYLKSLRHSTHTLKALGPGIDTGAAPSSASAPLLPRVIDLNEKIIVKATPDYLCRYFKDHTAVHAALQTQRYLSKWLEVSGSIRNVSPLGDEWHVSIDPANSEVQLVFLRFKSEWGDRLQLISKGEAISAVGKITGIEAYALYLEECTLCL